MEIWPFAEGRRQCPSPHLSKERNLYFRSWEVQFSALVLLSLPAALGPCGQGPLEDPSLSLSCSLAPPGQLGTSLMPRPHHRPADLESVKPFTEHLLSTHCIHAFVQPRTRPGARNRAASGVCPSPSVAARACCYETVDPPHGSLGQTSCGGWLSVWPPKPSWGMPGGGWLGPWGASCPAKQTHVVSGAVVLGAFGVILPNIRGVFQRPPSAPSQAVSVGPS